MSTEKSHDIFLSYSSNDKERVRPIVEAIEKEGVTVWWDDNIPPGTTWREFIQENLDASKLVVVIWSSSSIKSKFVQDEAQEGQDRNSLLPIRIEDVRIPIGFRSEQTIQLFDWDGKPNEDWQKLIKGIRAKLGRTAKPSKKKEKQSEQAWKKALKANTIEAFYDFLNHNWHSPHAKEALQRAQALEKEEQQRAERRKQVQQQQQTTTFGSQRPFSVPATTNFDYWAKRLNAIQPPASSSSTDTSWQQYTPPVTAPGEAFVFYKSFVFWASLLVFPLLGLGGAWVADQAVGWGGASFADLEGYSYMPKSWLYITGVVWGILYFIQGTIGAYEFDDWTEFLLALWTPFESIFDFDEATLGGLMSALPINLITSWSIALVGAVYMSGTILDGVSPIILGVVTLVQAVAYYRLDF